MDLFDRIAALRREGRPFVVATVVGRRAPVSAHLGDRAIVFDDGRMEGFVGGACSRELIRTQALDALRARCSRLVSIQPDATAASASSEEHVVVPMTCVSEGAIDVYVEPFVPARRLIVAGATPVAESLARLGRSMDYEVVRVVDVRERRDVEQEASAAGATIVTLDALESVLPQAGSGAEVAAVVASQGHYDEEALDSILRRAVPYVGLVASRTRGASVRTLLEKRGVPNVATIRIPAGLDLHARTPSEVALSILAEIVQARPSGVRLESASAGSAPAGARTTPAASAIDPVCGMEVDVATARHVADVDGRAYYFCCEPCRARFLEDPRRYLTHAID